MSWYPVTEVHPPRDIRVRVCWGGRVFETARVWHRKAKAEKWVVVKDERLAIVDLDGGAPEAWQPLAPGSWLHRLPEPVPPPLIKAGATVKTAPRSQLPAKLWWYEPEAVRRSEPGYITPREAEGRMLRALVASSSITLDGPSTKGNSHWIARMVTHEAMIAGDRPTYFHDRYQIAGADVDDFLCCMGWFAALNPVEMRGTEPWLFNRLQEAIWQASRIPPMRPHPAYPEALRRLTRVANNQRVYPHLATVDQIEALRERNRAYKRAAVV